MRPLPRIWRRVAGCVALAALATAAGCSFGAPDPASKEGDRVFSLWQGFAFTALGVGAVVWGLLIYVLVRYRRRRSDTDEHLPPQGAYHVPLEVVYTLAPIVIVAVLFGFSVAAEDYVTELDDDADAVQVEVIGFQWSWEFRYPDDDVTITGEPGEPPELVLPVDRPAHLELISTDVAHSFWIPDFLSKRDLIPGVENEIQVTPTEEGSYVGRCAEFCGLDHWAMNYTVRVVSEGAYETWLADESERSG
ncbi:MAG: aa3-type cytochrome oxidase subunit II [Acidimicrobiales bacterium]